jgi:hypothetical protein
VSEDKTTHKLVINLSVHYWIDYLNWNLKKSKSGEEIKDGYWIGKGEDIFVTKLIYTKEQYGVTNEYQTNVCHLKSSPLR